MSLVAQLRRFRHFFSMSLMAFFTMLSGPLGITDPLRTKQILWIRNILTASIFCSDGGAPNGSPDFRSESWDPIC